MFIASASRAHLRWLALLLLAIFSLSFGTALAQSSSEPKRAPLLKPDNVPNPGARLWKGVRGEISGVTQVRGIDTGVLIRSGGQDWRHFRMDVLIPNGLKVLAGMLALLVVYFLIKGRIRLPGGRSGQTIERNSLNQRVAHWCMAGLFIALGLTGLITLYGRSFLIDWLGPRGFGMLAAASKEVHNLLGPLFGLAIVWVFFAYVRANIYQRGDLTWLAKGGGFIGSAHPSSWKFNPGEKILFWLTVFMGVAITASGVVLDFPNLGQGREAMELAHRVHGVVAVLFIALVIGHIFLATLGVEATFEAISKGTVDANWAKAHHDLWYEQVTGEPAGQPRESQQPRDGGLVPGTPPGQ